MKKYVKGQAFSISAQDMNNIISATNHVNNNLYNFKSETKPDTIKAGIIDVYNDGENDIDIYNCAFIQEELQCPEPAETIEDILVCRPVLTVKSEPIDNDWGKHTNPMCVAQEPIPGKGIGKAMIIGLTWVVIKFEGGGSSARIREVNNDSKLLTDYFGCAKVLWKSFSPWGDIFALIILHNSLDWNTSGNAEYHINRTLASHDEKSWNPRNNIPENWIEYGTVKLTLPHLRYKAGASPGFWHIPQSYVWLACYAPVIEEVEVTEAEVVECEEEES